MLEKLFAHDQLDKGTKRIIGLVRNLRDIIEDGGKNNWLTNLGDDLKSPEAKLQVSVDDLKLMTLAIRELKLHELMPYAAMKQWGPSDF